jgi:hypothetical protein
MIRPRFKSIERLLWIEFGVTIREDLNCQIVIQIRKLKKELVESIKMAWVDQVTYAHYRAYVTADFIDHYSKAWGKGTFLTFKGDAVPPTVKFQ